MKDIRQVKNYASYLNKNGWQVKKIEGVQFSTRKIFGLLKIIKIQRPENINIDIIQKINSQKGLNIIIIEPKTTKQSEIIKQAGFRQISPYSPSKTLIIDLRKSFKEILKLMKKDCRYSIKKTAKIKLTKCNINDISKFQKAWKNSVNFRKYLPSLTDLKKIKESFGKKSLFLLYQKNRSRSGAIFLRTNKTAYYWQAFTNRPARKELIQYQIVWQAIRWAKKNNCHYFDFEGIFDPRFPNKRWLGFTHFKKSFGGKEKSYPGAFLKISLNLL